MDGKRHISLLFTICFSVFLGHNLVPHQHHAEIICVSKNSECPVDNNGHHDENPSKHCHAFNSIEFVYFNHTEIKQPISILTLGFVPDTNEKLQQQIAVKFNQYVCLKIPDKTTRYMGAISMRAPPISA